MALTRDEKIFKLGKEITDRAKVMLGLEKLTTDSPEYWGIDSALKFIGNKYGQNVSVDSLELLLCMKKRVPVTLAQLQKKSGYESPYLDKLLEAVSDCGLVEYNWENMDGKNPSHEKRWILDMFVPIQNQQLM